MLTLPSPSPVNRIVANLIAIKAFNARAVSVDTVGVVNAIASLAITVGAFN